MADAASDYMAVLDEYAQAGGPGGTGVGLGGTGASGGSAHTPGSKASAGFGDTASSGVTMPPTGGPMKKSKTHVEELEQEMKLLHWHKLANEAALKAALIRTKRLRDKDRSGAVTQRQREKEAWMQRIIEEEQNKPLEVTDDFIRTYEEREREESERLDNEVQRHIENLKSLKADLSKRAEEKQRNARFRAKKAQLKNSAAAIVAEKMKSPEQKAREEAAGQQPASQLDEIERIAETAAQQAGTGIVTSLNRLVDLESRIANLEDNALAEYAKGARGPADKTGMVFRKKRTATSLDSPAKTFFSVQMLDKRDAKHLALKVGGTPIVTPGGVRPAAAAVANTTAVHMEGARRRKRAVMRSGVTDPRAQRQDAVINNWLEERKAKQAARRARIEARSRPRQAAHAGARLHAQARTHGAGGRAGAGRARAGGVGVASRTGGAGMGRGRGGGKYGIQQFRQVRQQFEDTRSNIRRGQRGPARVGPGASRRRGGPLGTGGLQPGSTRRTQGTRSTWRSGGQSTLGSRLGGGSSMRSSDRTPARGRGRGRGRQTNAWGTPGRRGGPQQRNARARGPGARARGPGARAPGARGPGARAGARAGGGRRPVGQSHTTGRAGVGARQRGRAGQRQMGGSTRDPRARHGARGGVRNAAAADLGLGVAGIGTQPRRRVGGGRGRGGGDSGRYGGGPQQRGGGGGLGVVGHGQRGGGAGNILPVIGNRR